VAVHLGRWRCIWLRGKVEAGGRGLRTAFWLSLGRLPVSMEMASVCAWMLWGAGSVVAQGDGFKLGFVLIC